MRNCYIILLIIYPPLSIFLLAKYCFTTDTNSLINSLAINFIISFTNIMLKFSYNY